MTCKRKKDEGGRKKKRKRKREAGKVCSYVWRGWEAFADLYINTFVKWAGVVEDLYVCVSVCVGGVLPSIFFQEAQTPQVVLFVLLPCPPLHVCIFS